MDLMVSKLCEAAPSVPHPVLQLFEQILCDVGHYDPQRLVHILTPYASADSVADRGEADDVVRLLALHVMCATIHFMSSAELLTEMDGLVSAVLPAVASGLVDVRKAVVFVLVEVYLTVGDALLPHLQALSASQRKLLTIYIEKKLASRSTKVVK